MSQTLTLSDELYVKLAQGAAERGLTIESLLAFVSDLVAPLNRPTQRDRERSRLIEGLLAKYSAEGLMDEDRAELDRLIDADFQTANARADRLIAGKKSQLNVPQASSSQHQNPSTTRHPCAAAATQTAKLKKKTAMSQ